MTEDEKSFLMDYRKLEDLEREKGIKFFECVGDPPATDEFINSLPLKEETIVGNNGVRISGGQKQRIGIARALYIDPEIIVFDEATSSLDEENEDRIMRDIDSLDYECIKIIVTHRLKTVKNCDEIYVLNNGLIIDHGKFDDLKNRGIL